MSKYRRAARTDANQSAIVKELRGLGYSVEPEHDDILVGYRGKTFWYEIKTGPKAVVKDSQKKLLKEYKGHYKIVWSTEMILSDIKKEMENV
jgi:hypothetical protein